MVGMRGLRCGVMLLLAPLALLAACARPTAPEPGAVPVFSLADRQSGTKYSALAQITPDNVRDLQVAWTYHTGELESDAALTAFEDDPVVIEGNLIICTVSRRIIALDPATGQERWAYDPHEQNAVMRKCRGVATWTDAQAADGAPCKTRLLFATGDNRLIAIDARSGAACEGFGEHGAVRMASSIPELFPGEVQATSRPAVINGVVVVGSSVLDNQRTDAPSGRVLAFDARTGAPRWEFDPLPRNRRHPASSHWPNGVAEHAGAANVWTVMSVDEERDLVFLPTSSPSPDFFGGARPGDNRFADSIVALRGSTGQVVWHFQFVHHDIWDADLPTAPLLIDYPVNGANVAALVQITKQGLVFIFNRETGEPLVPIEERPVPQSGQVAEEAPLSPTQPFPVGMPAITPQGFSAGDVWGFTPWDRNSCRRQVEAVLHGPLYTPPSEQGTVFMPGPAGGANWGGGAYDPQSHIMVVPTARAPWVLTMIRRGEQGQQTTNTNRSFTYPNAGAPYETRIDPMLSSFGAPCSRPPWAALTAIDLVRKEIVWEVPFGTIDRLAPVPIPLRLGAPGAGAPLVTAGGLVFIGYTLDHRFRAFDLHTGEELWRAPPLPAPANATPITYEAGGEQYVVITVGGHSVYRTAMSDTVMAYRLRRGARSRR